MHIEYIHKRCCVCVIIVDLIATFPSYSVSTIVCISLTCCTDRVQLGKLFGGKIESLISWLFFWSIFLAKWDLCLICSCFFEVDLMEEECLKKSFQLQDWKVPAPLISEGLGGGVGGGESKIVVVHGSFKPVQYNLFVLTDPLDVDSGLLYGLFHRCRSRFIGFGKTLQLYKQTKRNRWCRYVTALKVSRCEILKYKGGNCFIFFFLSLTNY